MRICSSTETRGAGTHALTARVENPTSGTLGPAQAQPFTLVEQALTMTAIDAVGPIPVVEIGKVGFNRVIAIQTKANKDWFNAVNKLRAHATKHQANPANPAQPVPEPPAEAPVATNQTANRSCDRRTRI